MKPEPSPEEQRASPTLRGVATYEDGTPAAGALIAVTSHSTAKEIAVVTTDRDGRFGLALDAGDYDLAATVAGAFGWVEQVSAPNAAVAITMSKTCRTVTGHAKNALVGTQIAFARKSNSVGDQFVAEVAANGEFSVCLPSGYYAAFLRGPIVSVVVSVDLSGDERATATTRLDLEGYAETRLKSPPKAVVHVRSDLDSLVADILRKDARLIGLGEATHGTAEFVTARATLTFELIRRADVRQVLFEFDAIHAFAIDDYVMGENVDLEKAVADLGFWITDTYELLRFFEQLRAYNATSRHKVHVAGIDLQDTRPPVALLLAHASVLNLSTEERTLLATFGEERGAPIKTFTAARRAALDSLLARLAKRPSTSRTDLRIAVAARSLLIQTGYFSGDIAGLYSDRRDAGMAALATFLATRATAPRTALWAHTAHVARDTDGDTRMGMHLAAVAANRYYPIGFYMHEGSVRAWDAAGAVGVISHRISPARDYMVEGAVMAATRSPDIAWVPVSGFSEPLRTWADMPRYVREVGSAFIDESVQVTLRNVVRAFDAVVVIKSGHDSSPTPTGVRKIEK